jgi:heterodisulfide reductase subunit C
VNLGNPDRDFIRRVEEESGQTVSKCYQCGNCSAACPMGFAYDFQVNRIMRMIQAGQKDAVLSSKSLWYCATCESCTVRCPNNIDVATVMDVCRHMARREKKKGVRGVRAFVFSFLETVRLFGRSYEMGAMGGFMALAMKPFTDLDLLPKVLPKRKLPLLPHAIQGRAEVAGIFNRYLEGKRDGK